MMGLAGLSRRLQREIGWAVQVSVILITCVIFAKSFIFSGNRRQDLSVSEIEHDNEVAEAVEIAQAIFVGKDPAKSNASKKKKKKLFDQEESDEPEPSHIPPNEVENNLKERFQYLKQQCSRLNLGLHKNEKIQNNFTKEELKDISSYPNQPMYQSLILSQKFNISYCSLKGAGDKWMAKRMLKMADVSRKNIKRYEDNILPFARTVFPYLPSWTKYPEITSTTFNFLIVRNPFDRIIVAYQDIFENMDFSSVFSKRYADFIIKIYRPDSSNIDSSDFNSLIPTFEEFCMFLIYQNVLPEQDSWKPLVRHCSPCSIAFNMIIQYDTLYQETSWSFVNKLGIDKKYKDYIKYSITPDVREEYFSTLTLKQINQLYNKYKLDFDLFGFDMQQFRNFAKNKDLTPKGIKTDVNNSLQNIEDNKYTEEKRMNLAQTTVENPDNQIIIIEKLKISENTQTKPYSNNNSPTAQEKLSYPETNKKNPEEIALKTNQIEQSLSVDEKENNNNFNAGLAEAIEQFFNGRNPESKEGSKDDENVYDEDDENVYDEDDDVNDEDDYVNDEDDDVNDEDDDEDDDEDVDNSGKDDDDDAEDDNNIVQK